jgi:hypothetical protein
MAGLKPPNLPGPVVVDPQLPPPLQEQRRPRHWSRLKQCQCGTVRGGVRALRLAMSRRDPGPGPSDAVYADSEPGRPGPPHEARHPSSLPAPSQIPAGQSPGRQALWAEPQTQNEGSLALWNAWIRFIFIVSDFNLLLFDSTGSLIQINTING